MSSPSLKVNTTTTSTQKKKTTPSKPIKKPPQLTKLAVSNKKHDSSREFLTDSGTFTKDDLIIGTKGIVTSKFAPSSPSNQFLANNYTPVDVVGSYGDELILGSTPPRRNSNAQGSPAPNQDKIPFDALTIKKKSKLGAGASANVLRVEYQNKPYALKIVPLFTGEVNPSLITREVKALYASLSCPYIIRFYEAYCRDGAIHILLEYMDCGSLEDVYKTIGKISEDVLSEITYQILQGLNYLEQQQIIHRDIKPSNILLNREGSVKISDFGMSRQLSTSIQGFKTFQGTFMYMSPERLKGEDHSFNSDIWSLGLTIAECATGQFPFNLEQFSVFEVLQYIMDNGANVNASSVSPELFQFIQAATQVNVAQRASAAELLQFEFITKYNDTSKVTKPKRLTDFLQNVYLPKRLQKQKERKGSIGKDSTPSDAATTQQPATTSTLAPPTTTTVSTPVSTPRKTHKRSNSGIEQSVLVDPNELFRI